MRKVTRSILRPPPTPPSTYTPLDELLRSFLYVYPKKVEIKQVAGARVLCVCRLVQNSFAALLSPVAFHFGNLS